MQKTCKQCSSAFEISKEDLAFYDKVSPVFSGKKELIPPPTLCPECRQQRRLAQVNQLNLYERKCDLTGSSIISNFPAKSPYRVYRQEDWHSDKWDPLTYGREMDFDRPFFDQFKELSLAVPRPSLFTGYEYDENSDYTNHAGKNKNCYLIFDSDENRDCYYSYSINHCEDCTDCYRVRRSQLCANCIDCVSCYDSAYLQDSENCTDSLFLKNCVGCKHCLMCSNLRNREYYVENKPVSKEIFDQLRAMLKKRTRMQAAIDRFSALKVEYPQKFIHGTQNEDVSGDYLVSCKNAYHCYDCESAWDCRYTNQGFMPLKDCMDIQECGEGELLYESCVCGYGLHSCAFCCHTLGQMNELYYCTYSPHASKCFGCIGVRRKKYCILNKQYTEEAYEKLAPKIIEHMRKTGEWGEFFPIASATFGYNETMAQDYFPLTREEATARRWLWTDQPISGDQYLGPAVTIPDDITDVPDDICSKIFRCSETGKPFKIIPQELKLHREIAIPLPHKSFFQRHKERMALRNPRKLWKRSCAKCKAVIETTYAPERPEIVYCEQCYLASVY